MGFHTAYLANLCSRRKWPAPLYQVSVSHQGYRCVVRVNNREYQTAKLFPTEVTAKEGAAVTAYSICRQFSANDGMYPAGFAHGGVIQGNPVPVGSDRHRRKNDSHSQTIQYDYSGGSSNTSPDSSPEMYDRAHLAQAHNHSRRHAPYTAIPTTNRHSSRRY